MKSEHLKRCQVATPPDIVAILWGLAHAERPEKRFDRVIDLGAGDARFAVGGDYRSYLGVEADLKRMPGSALRNGARLVHQDALLTDYSNYGLAIGNPPYVRHHFLDGQWRDMVHRRLQARGIPQLKKTANLFVLFLAQALASTRADGLVVQLIPFEWVTRPSAAELRQYIKAQGWSVKVYRFRADIFPTVLTTASITIIDKSDRSGRWTFGEVGRDGIVKATTQPSGTRENVLPYADREAHCHGIRGLSPGGQDIFVLTEEERLFYGLHRRTDVMPCVTSLRGLAHDVTVLDEQTFEAHYVRTGSRCWLIRSDRDKLSPRLERYLASVGDAWKAYSTCTVRPIWYRYRNHPAPQILLSSGFVGKTPKLLTNPIGVVAAGSVYGVYVSPDQDEALLARRLRNYDFRKRIVQHSNNLNKIEVRQLNTVLKRLTV